MHLYIGTHATCVTTDEDLRQPLSDQGCLDVTHVAGFLSLFHRPAPNAIWHSNRLAAIQTAAMIAKTWQVERCEQQTFLYPEADVSALLTYVRHCTQDCALIGHNAHLQALIAHLLGCQTDAIALANGSMVCLQGKADRWQLQWSLLPELFYHHSKEPS